MNSTTALFDGRKREIEFYFSIMTDIDSDTGRIRTIDNSRFLRILKSNFLLMLYNLIEACIASGMQEIYESLRSNESCYTDLIDEVRILWSNHRIGEIYKSAGVRSSYEKAVQDILEQAINHQPIILDRHSLLISGNLDAKQIKALCDKHRIRYVASDNDGCLRTVKEKRQNLAHGDESFGDCARDLSLGDLERMKDQVIGFIECILNGMRDYYDNKQYLKANAR